MDQLYEYDREPVQESALEPGRHFAGLFARPALRRDATRSAAR